MNSFQTTQALQILEDLTAHVNGKGIGSVVHGIGICVGVIAHVNGHTGIHIIADQVFADNHNRHTSRTNVLLNATINQTVVRNIDGFAEVHGALVRNQDFAFGVGQSLVGGTVNGFVFADVHVVSVWADGQISYIGNIAKVAVLA